MNSARVVKTGLENNPVNETIIDSVIGQMSDGMWEETYSRRGKKGYYRCVNPAGADLRIAPEWGVQNPYDRMTDAQVLMFFARKIRRIVNQEIKDFHQGIMNESAASEYLGAGWRGITVTFADAVNAAITMTKTAKLTGGSKNDK